MNQSTWPDPCVKVKRLPESFICSETSMSIPNFIVTQSTGVETFHSKPQIRARWGKRKSLQSQKDTTIVCKMFYANPSSRFWDIFVVHDSKSNSFSVSQPLWSKLRHLNNSSYRRPWDHTALLEERVEWSPKYLYSMSWFKQNTDNRSPVFSWTGVWHRHRGIWSSKLNELCSVKTGY